MDQVPEGDDAGPAVFRLFAPGATHAPHHVPEHWIERWKGKFEQGWDKMREEMLARQIKNGIVPAGTPLAPKPDAIPDWDTLTDDEKKPVHPPGRSICRLCRNDGLRDWPGGPGR